MSAIASAFVLPASDLAELVRSAAPQRRFLGGVRDLYPKTLARLSASVPDFEGSGWILNTVLPFLKERGADLLTGAHEQEAGAIASARGEAMVLILDSKHRDAHLQSLREARFSEAELENYYREFNETDPRGAGAAMQLGIDWLVMLLERLEMGRVAVVNVG